MKGRSKTTSKSGKLFAKENYGYKLYKHVVENLREGVWIGRKNKGIATLYWNRGAEKISGFKKRLITEETILTIVPGLGRVLEEIAGRPPGRKKYRITVERYPYSCPRQPNHPLYLNLQAYYLSFEQLIVVIFEDVTEKTRMEKNIMQQNRELSTLNQIGHTVSQTLQLNTVLNTALDKVLEAMDCESGGIYIRETAGGDDLVLRVNKGLSPAFLRKFRRIRLGAGLMGKGLERHEAVILESVTKQTRLTEYRAPRGIKLAVSVPITVKERLIGALNVGSYVSGTFDSWKVELLLTIGSHIGVVIENAILMDSLKQHERDLKALSSQIIRAQEEERKRIARELHDEASQALIAAKINLEMIEKSLPPSLEEGKARLVETSSLLVNTLENLRRLSHDLRPSMLDDLGLVPTLRWYTEAFSKRIGIPITFHAGTLTKRPSFEIETVIYRIVQEALTNIAKYAKAKKVSISLREKNSLLVATVVDNGKGFKRGTASAGEGHAAGSGILGMKERVNSVGGTFHLESKRGTGTRLSVSVPLAPNRQGNG